MRKLTEGDDTMDELNYISSFSSGWKRINRESSDKEQQMAHDFLQGDAGVHEPMSRQISDNTLSMTKKAAASSNTMLSFEESQKEIIDKINQLQVELSSMRQLLSDMQTNIEMKKLPNHKQATESKFSRFFK
jgi:hypothetical protein